MKGYYDAEYVIDGITYGFYIGVDPELDDIDDKLCNSPLYIKLNKKQKRAIAKWFQKGIEKGYIAGPFDKDYKFPWPLHISPLFVVPKPLKDEYRPIAHLSHKRGIGQYSVNDILNEEEKHVKYIQFKEIVDMMLNAGKNDETNILKSPPT